MQVSSGASNALYAKCRSMFGKRLTLQNIQHLLSCQSLSEVAVYLKSNTHYACALAGIDERIPHRGQLEAALKQMLFQRYESLCRYELSVGEKLSEYVLMRMELEQFLTFLRFLNEGRPQEYLFSIPVFFDEHTAVDLFGLSRVTTYADFLEHIKPSSFHKALCLLPVSDGGFDYALVENAMYAHLYSTAIELAQHNYTGTARQQLLDLFGTDIELNNVMSIYRLKKYYNASPDVIRSLIYPYTCRISRRVINQMIAAESADEVISLFLTCTPYKREASKEKFNRQHIDNVFRELRYKRARKYIRFSTNPSVVLLSYMFISETELTELITIIEGVRYSLPPGQIADLIVMDDY